MPSDDPREPLEDSPVGFHMEEGAAYDPPPEDYPDLGMGTAAEEAALAEEVRPELEDGGMSAGYPPTRDEDLPNNPEIAIPKPDPAAMSGAPFFSTASFEPPGPGSAAGGRQSPLQEAEKPAEAQIVQMLVTEEEIKALWSRAHTARQGVIDNITTLPVAEKMLDYIQAARNELLGGARNYEEAERFINEVEYRVILRKNLKDLSRGYTLGLYFYEIGWAVALFFFLISGLGVEAAFASAKMEGTPDLIYLLSSMIWGGFGGVIGALLALVKHISIDQDYDKQHTWWYLSSPPMGVGIGAVVYLFLHVGLSAIMGANANIASPLVIYVFAWLAGYQQNVFTDLVKRMMKTLMGKDQTPKGTENQALAVETPPVEPSDK